MKAPQKPQPATCATCGESDDRGTQHILDAHAPVWMAETWDGETTWHQVTGWVALVAHEAVCRGVRKA